MALKHIGLGLLGDVLEGARPLLQRGGDRKQLQQAAARADSQAHLSAARQAPAPLEVELVVGVAQVARIKASPAWRWDGAGWRCGESETQVSIWFAHGPHHTVTLPAGARVTVAAGLIHFPRS